MTLQTPQSVVTTGTTPTPITPTASDTFPVGSFGPAGMFLRVITTGTATNVAIQDPGFTSISNPGTVTAVAAPATGVRMADPPGRGQQLRRRDGDFLRGADRRDLRDLHRLRSAPE
jgi:hypothetical protein